MNRSLTVNPTLEICERGGQAEIILPYEGFRLPAAPPLRDAIDRLRATEDLSALLSSEAIRFLCACNVLVPRDHAAVLGRGLLAPTPTCLGSRANLADLRLGRRRAAVAIVGAPFDTTAHYDRSPRTGPDAIRRAWSATAAERDLYVDLGDTVHHSHDEPLSAAGVRLAQVIGSLLRSGTRPIVLGGDHSVSYYAVRAVADAIGPIGVIHFDAHHDMTPPPPLRAPALDHATVMSWILADARVEVMAQVGLRPWLSAPEDRGWGHKVRRMLSSDGREAIGATLRALPSHLPYYVTIDMDVLDASVAGKVTTPAADGLLLSQLLEYLSEALGHVRWAAADIVEVCAAGDSIERSASAACDVIRLLGDLSRSSGGEARP
jgi:agmatinase